MPELRLGVLRGGKVVCGPLIVEVEQGVTCREFLDHLTDGEDGPLSGAERGAWHLIERWYGCERRLDDVEKVAEAARLWGEGVGRVWLKYEQPVTSSGRRVTSLKRRRRKVDYLSGPLTDEKISQLKRDLRRLCVSTSVQASSLWLERMGQRRSLTRDKPLEPLRERLANLRELNLKLSKEISQLNMEAGGLSVELNAVRAESRELSEGVRRVEEEVGVWRRERERESRTRVADLHTEAIRLRRELETRNRLNSAQSSKLQAMKKYLEEKQREVASQKVAQQHDNQPAMSCDPSGMTTPPRSKGDSPRAQETPSHTPSGSISGGSRKRRAAFEARTRQLLEAEGEEFKRQREGERGGQGFIRKLDFSTATSQATIASETTPPSDPMTNILPAGMIEEGNRLLTVPEADTEWYISCSEEPSYREKIDRVLGGGMEVKGETGDHTHLFVLGGDFFNEVMSSVEQSVGKEGRERKERKRVRFSPEAVILTAALEGDLPTLRDCVEKLGGCRQTSHKGATCLHNAVVSGHQPSLQYLVEMGCDINAQDDDGWTPLHCAVAYSNAEAVTYLLSHGASLWLETGEEGETAMELGERELAAQKEEGDRAGQEAAFLCLTLLQEAHRDMGVANGGVISALFPREATEEEEKSIREGERLVVVTEGRGEGWWEVEGGGEKRGMVPATFLGSSPRYQVTL